MQNCTDHTHTTLCQCEHKEKLYQVGGADRNGKDYILEAMIQYFFGNRNKQHEKQKADENFESDAGISQR